MSFSKRYATSQLGVLEFKGSWNAATNTPPLTSSSGDKGDYYIVSVAGTSNIDGIIDWQPGDWVVFSGTVWQKLDNSEVVEVVNSMSGNETDRSPSVNAIKLYVDTADTGLDGRLNNVETNLTTSVVSIFENNAAVYADARPPLPDPNYREGWYFKNTGPVGVASQNKVNWYFFDGTAENITLGDFSGYAVLTMDSLASKPHLGIYTVPGASGNAASWYRSRKVFIIDPSASVVAGKKYLMYFGTDPKVHPELPRLPMVVAPAPSAPVGPLANNERVLTAVFSSDSGTAIGNCQFVAEAIGIYSPTVRRKINLKIRSILLPQLENEATIRANADISLQNALAAESTARIQELTEEATAREAADTAISGDLATETARAQVAETALTLLANEAKDRSFHIGTQLSSTISDFVESVHVATVSLFGEGNDINILYPDENGKVQAVLKPTGVQAGSYNVVTVDNKGRIIAATNNESGVVGKETLFTNTINTTTLTSFIDINGLSSSNLLPGLYQFTFKALVNSTSTGTGIGVKLVAKTANISTVYAKYSITQAVPGTTQSYEYDQISQNTNVTSTSAPSTAFGFVIQGEGVVRVVATGSISMQFRSEVQDSAVSINEDAILVLEKL